MARKIRAVDPDDPEDIFVDALEHYDPSFLACRDMGHPWRLTSPFRLVDASIEDAPTRGGLRIYAERTFTCQRCGKKRSDAFAISQSSHGHTSLRRIAPSRYDDPDGYAIKGIGPTQGLRDLLYGVAFDIEARKRRR